MSVTRAGNRYPVSPPLPAKAQVKHGITSYEKLRALQNHRTLMHFGRIGARVYQPADHLAHAASPGAYGCIESISSLGAVGVLWITPPLGDMPSTFTRLCWYAGDRALALRELPAGMVFDATLDQTTRTEPLPYSLMAVSQ
jgi:hypothetical protein